MATALRVAPISQDCSDGELVAAVRSGSDAAFEELYSRYSHRIGTYVLSKVGDHGRAEDVTQEIFMAALRRMRETDREIAFKAWIYEIAKNACIDSFRRGRRAQEVSLDADEGLSPADRVRLTVVATPDAALDTKQAIHDLRGAFTGLSESHHEILVLRELEGRSYRDIGERLGMSLPMVESTLFRARRRLSEEYNELTSGRRCEFVVKMVDSGPHYSLGIRDRRRIARHLAHCQPCRAHARSVGFDVSILSVPSVAARIAALLPVPFLRARWGALEHLEPRHGRPSLILRSVHALAHSSEQIVGTSPGAGRGAATAAALVLAGLGGGIMSTTSSPPANSFHRTVPAAVYPAPAAEAATAVLGVSSSRTATAGASARAGKTRMTSSRVSRSHGSAGRAAIRGTAKAALPARSEPRAIGPAAPAGPSRTSGTRSSGGGNKSRAGDPTAAGKGGTTGPTTSAGSSPPAQSTPPTLALPTGAVASGVSSTLGAVVGAIPQIPTGAGTAAGSSTGGSTVAGSIAGTINGITTGVAQLVGS